MSDIFDSDTNEEVLNAIDEYIGARIRIRRNLLGLSQDQLAKSLRISFQQVQKYEKGSNRIAGSRIWQLARTLNIPVSYFFDGIERSLSFKGYNIPQYASDCLCDADEGFTEIPMEMENSVRELVDAFISIKDPVVANHILDLVKSLAQKETDNSFETSF
ncbi:MAG: helix-turn-helix transcriptional regulator [Alphaproteobacteria bacterium]|nr:helix-turn-helix transcriptional regulator [Alphaproteobacteria bacterium]